MWVPYEFFQLPSRRITTLRTWRVQLWNNESHFNLLWSMKTLKLPTHMAFSVLIEMLCHCARDFHLANTVSADDWSRLCGNILFSQRTALHGTQISIIDTISWVESQAWSWYACRSPCRRYNQRKRKDTETNKPNKNHHNDISWIVNLFITPFGPSGTLCVTMSVMQFGQEITSWIFV